MNTVGFYSRFKNLNLAVLKLNPSRGYTFAKMGERRPSWISPCKVCKSHPQGQVLNRRLGAASCLVEISTAAVWFSYSTWPLLIDFFSSKINRHTRGHFFTSNNIQALHKCSHLIIRNMVNWQLDVYLLKHKLFQGANIPSDWRLRVELFLRAAV